MTIQSFIMENGNMEILVVNDDGVFAEGIAMLANALKPYGNITVVAPSKQRSAVSASLLLGQSIEFERVDVIPGIEAYSCSGMPVDCVRLATSVLHKEFDLVFSGINNGLNVGTDVIYSGTVAAAREAVIEGIPAVAVSCDWHWFQYTKKEIDGVLEYVFKNKMYSNQYCLNINFPVNKYTESKGIRITKQGIKSFKSHFMRNNIGSYDCVEDVITYDTDMDTDVNLGLDGYITITTIGIDQTNYSELEKLKKRMEE